LQAQLAPFEKRQNERKAVGTNFSEKTKHKTAWHSLSVKDETQEGLWHSLFKKRRNVRRPSAFPVQETTQHKKAFGIPCS